MFGKKKQKQETLVRMRNLAQLDEGFFAHMKDGKDMFDATAREIRKMCIRDRSETVPMNF